MDIKKFLGIGAGAGILGFIGYKLGLFGKSAEKSPVEYPEKSETPNVDEYPEKSVPGGVASMQVPAVEGGVANLPPTTDLVTSSDSSGGGGKIVVPTSADQTTTTPTTPTKPSGHLPPKAPTSPVAKPTPNPMTDPKAAAAARSAGLAASMPSPTPQKKYLAHATTTTLKTPAQIKAAQIAAQAIAMAQAAQGLKAIPPPSSPKFSLTNPFRK